MAMSKKHYVRVAAIIAAERAMARTALHTRQHSKAVGKLEVTRDLALSLSDVFKADNGAFDRDRFLYAAGITDRYVSTGEEVA